jgi:hypothetical protein
MVRCASLCLLLITLLYTLPGSSQEKAKADSSFKPSGKLWGLSFGDYYYKAHADALNRGGANQYTGIEQGRNAFQIRRVYLGYTYDISQSFSAELLLAAEDNIINSNGVATGDLLGDNKLSLYIKLANLRWKNVWKGTDLVIGQVTTPAFSLVTEPVWGYRAVERTVADLRRTPSFDLGATLQGKFDSKANFGYNIMVANGNGARPENDKYKWFYGDVFAKFLDKRLVFDLYADYVRMNHTATWHHSHNMVKGFAAYTTPAFTVGVEAFTNHGKEDNVGINGAQKDTINANAVAVSSFVKGVIIKDKLGFLLRVDDFNPNVDFDNNLYASYKGLSANYEPNNRELFFTGGLDFTPVKNVHFIPNVWYNRYTSNQAGTSGNAYRDHDLVYRLTFYYVYR